MQLNTKSGMEVLFRPAEELVPYEYWLTWLKNLAIECINEAHLPKHIGNKYAAEDFWEFLIIHAFLNLSLDESSDQLNDLLWQEERKHQRLKITPKIYDGTYQRKERKCQNGDQVRKYRSELPNYLVKKLNQYIFERQIDFALENGLIKHEIELLIDNTDQWYYGNDRYPDNLFITKGYNGPGTNRKRKYLGLMLKSGTTNLYCGVELIRKKHSNMPYMMRIIDWLIQKGFQIKSILADRWFPTYDFLAELEVRGIDYIGPYRKWAPIKRILIDYLKTGKNYIIPYAIKGAPAKYYHSPKIPCWLILTNRRGRRLRDIRTEYIKGVKSLKDCMKEIMIMMTTRSPPKGKKRKQGWAVQICHSYDHRWQIETGFRDLNRITPPSNARTNTRKFFMTTVRYWVFNCWQIERAKRKKLRRCPKSWRMGPTLRRFTYCVIKLEVA